MAKLHVEGETFETAFVPLNENGRPGITVNVRFATVPDTIDEKLAQDEEQLWQEKVADAAAKGQNLTKGFQYGLRPDQATQVAIRDDSLVVPVSKIWYSRIELAKKVNSTKVPNVLALCEILTGPDGYLFVERGGIVAYHGGTSQLHALVAGNYPRNLKPAEPRDMMAETWLEAQQQTEHAIKPEEVSNRQLLGIILDRTLGYKPDIAFTASAAVSAETLATRFAVDAWEKKGIREFPATVTGLRQAILEHRDIKRHVPPGYGAAILELVRMGGILELDRLNSEGRQSGAPIISYKII